MTMRVLQLIFLLSVMGASQIGYSESDIGLNHPDNLINTVPYNGQKEACNACRKHQVDDSVAVRSAESTLAVINEVAGDPQKGKAGPGPSDAVE